MTGLAILVSGAMDSGLNGVALTNRAFSLGLPGSWGNIVVTLGIALFAFSTIIGWNYYGEKAMEYLLGIKAVIPYRLVYVVLVFVGAVVQLELVWTFADVANALMIIPNLIGLIGLRKVVISLTRKYFQE